MPRSTNRAVVPPRQLHDTTLPLKQLANHRLDKTAQLDVPTLLLFFVKYLVLAAAWIKAGRAKELF